MNEAADELRRLSRLFHASSRVSQTMIQARSFEEVVAEICRRLIGEGGFALAWMGRREAPGAPVVLLAWSAAAPCSLAQIKVLTTDAANGTGPNQAKALVWNDYAAQCRGLPGREFAGLAGLSSAAVFPIQCGGGATGVLALYSAELNFFGGKEMSLLEDVAESVSLGLNHLHQEVLQTEELAYERSLLRALMDNSWNLIYFKDLESRFIRASKGLYERFGTTAEGIIGKSDFDFFRKEHAQEAFDDEQNIIHTGKPVTGKIERETWKTGEDSWCITAKMPLRDDAGQIIGTVGISKDFTAVKQAEAKLEEMHSRLVEASRVAGMAEVATSILHNVGNVLNSVNVSSIVVSDKIRTSRIVNIAKLAGLLQENAADLPAFFNGPKGRKMPSYLSDLGAHLVAEREEILRELQSLTSNIEHIKEIVAAQQSYARNSGVLESIQLSELLEAALEMHKAAMGRHAVNVIREYQETPPVLVDKHKVLQILVNLLHNAKYALDEGSVPEKRLTLRVEKPGHNGVRVSVIDNGIGIAPEHLPRVFEHGFTTRKDGHGFGLHSGAITAKELGGSLQAHSDGVGLGAKFILEIPCEPKKPRL
jgi:PAS domain S-box-containing protein